MRDARDDLTELRAALRTEASGVAEALLGPRNKKASTRNTWRWGGKGSLAVEVAGRKRGVWFSHEAEQGNDLLGLIRHVRGSDFPDALAWARDFTGFAAEKDDGDKPRRPRPSPPPDRNDAADAAEAADMAARIAKARDIVAAGVPLGGTPGARYFKQHRGVPEPVAGWPSSILWHPGYRAVLAVARDADGAIQAVQRIHLGDDDGKLSGEEVERRKLPAAKVTNGVLDGAAVRLPGDPAGPLLIAEGPETGLACHAATGHEIWIALGSVAKVTPPKGRRVVVVADDNPPAHDPKYGKAAKALRKAVREWRRAGVDLVVATPWEVRRRDRSDMADVILDAGVDAVRARIAAVLEPPSKAVARLPLAAAGPVIGAAVARFFTDVRAFDPAGGTALTPFVYAARNDVAGGKSHYARLYAAELLAWLRQRGDGRTVVIAVPTHALGDEQARRFEELPVARAAGLTAAVWRGRAAPDPAAPDFADPAVPKEAKTKMCRDLERVEDARSVGLPVQESACRRRIEGPGGKAWVACPLFETCSYQAQRRRKADLWFAPHDLIFAEKPNAVGEIAALVVDEGCWQDGLEGEHNPLALSLDAFAQADVIRVGKERAPDHTSTDRLRFLQTRLLDAARDMSDGVVRRDAMGASRLADDAAAEARKLVWMAKHDPGMHPGMTRERRKEAMKAAEGNRTIPRRAMAWDALRALLAPGGPEASGRIALATVETKDGPVRVFHLKGRKDVREGWRVPTLLLDATLPLKLVSEYWPDVELVGDVRIATPYQRVLQAERAYAKGMLEPLDAERARQDPEEARRRLNRLHDLRALIIWAARAYAPGEVLVVLQKAIKEALLALGPMPPGVHFAHHNAVAGRDEWRHVALEIVVGRTMPPPGAVERIAEALTGKAMSNPVAWYERVDAAREMADGSTVPAEADCHPDPVAEEVRWQICEGQLVQIIGRPRGARRTAANPVDVLVLTDVPLPLPVERMLDAADLTPGPAAHMLATGGMVIENPTDAAAAYPDLWATRAAAKSAFQRAKLGAFPYRELFIGECTQLRRVEYQSAGRGKSAVLAGYDPVLCPDPVAFLAAKLGPLAWCRIEDAPEPELPAPEPLSPCSPEPRPPSQPASPEPSRVGPAVSVPRVPAAGVGASRGLPAVAPIHLPADDDGDQLVFGPVLGGGAVHAFGATWHGSGD